MQLARIPSLSFSPLFSSFFLHSFSLLSPLGQFVSPPIYFILPSSFLLLPLFFGTGLMWNDNLWNHQIREFFN